MTADRNREPAMDGGWCPACSDRGVVYTWDGSRTTGVTCRCVTHGMRNQRGSMDPDAACTCRGPIDDHDHEGWCRGWDVARKQGIAPYRRGRGHGYPWVFERSDR